jgi:hypothetical protein
VSLSKIPTNVDEMRKSVLAEYQRLVDGVITPEQAKASGNLAGKVLGLTSMEVEARRLAGKNTMIPFVDVKYEGE